MIKAQQRFISILLEDLKPNWNNVSIHFEYITIDEEVFEVYTDQYFIGKERIQLFLSLDATDSLVELNKHIPAGQSEKWTSVDFSMDKSGKYKFEYGYGIPPSVKETLERRKKYE